MIKATGYDNASFVLVTDPDSKPLKKGMRIFNFRGEGKWLQGGAAPHGPDKNGYVYTSSTKNALECHWDRSYASVYDLKWVKEADYSAEIRPDNVPHGTSKPKLDLKEAFPRSVTVTEKMIQFHEGNRLVNSVEYKPGRLAQVSDVISGWNEWALSSLDLFAELGPIKRV